MKKTRNVVKYKPIIAVNITVIVYMETTDFSCIAINHDDVRSIWTILLFTVAR